MLNLSNEFRAVATCAVLFLIASVTRDFALRNYDVDAVNFNETVGERELKDLPRDSLLYVYRTLTRLQIFRAVTNVSGVLGAALRFITLISALILVF
ncbi:MAG: hypothetical protein IJS65_06645 [Clostridia bacterium]|nr:hypothetical protein [Clostridia bacterium]